MQKIFLSIVLLMVAHNSQAIVLFEEDFSDNSAGWILGTEWEIGPAVLGPAGTGGVSGGNDPEFDHTATGDNGLAGVVIGGNASTALHDFYYLTSPVFNTAGTAGLTLEFYRWLVSDYSPYMDNSVEVYDGSEWITIWLSGPAQVTLDTDWTQQLFDISSYANAAMQVRFGFNIDSGGVYTSPSWSLDDVSVYSREVVAQVSTPESLLLILLGLYGLLVTRNRHKC